jgi:hypothetical protein
MSELPKESLPALLKEEPDSVRLPVSYEEARIALATCDSIDECRAWASTAEVLASYAKQAKDETLLDCAWRIKARAVRRCGELLQEIPAKAGRPPENWEGAHPISRASAAAAAGLSEHQRKTGLRIASIPAPEFEAAVESPRPPTVTKLAELGTPRRARAEQLERGRRQRFEAFLGGVSGSGEVAKIFVAEPWRLPKLTPRDAAEVIRISHTTRKWLLELERKAEEIARP